MYDPKLSQGCCYSIWCSQLPMVIFHWSILPPPSLPPSQIAPSPLMLHNLGLSGCFWWNVTTAIYTKPRSKTSGANVTLVGGFQKMFTNKFKSNSILNWQKVISYAFIDLQKIILIDKVQLICIACIVIFFFRLPWPQINQDLGLLNVSNFAPNLSFWQS